MTEFKLSDYEGKVAMHCATMEEAELFAEFLNENGRTWCTGNPYPGDLNYGSYGSETCYAFNLGKYCKKDFYRGEGYTVLEFRDFSFGIKANDPIVLDFDILDGWIDSVVGGDTL